MTTAMAVSRINLLGVDQMLTTAAAMTPTRCLRSPARRTLLASHQWKSQAMWTQLRTACYIATSQRQLLHQFGSTC